MQEAHSIQFCKIRHQGNNWTCQQQNRTRQRENRTCQQSNTVWEMWGEKETIMCADRDKQTLSVYDTNGKENTSSRYGNIEKASDWYVCIYECGKHFCCSTYKRVFKATVLPISNMEELFEKLQI